MLNKLKKKRIQLIFTQNDIFFSDLAKLSEKSKFAQLVTTIIFDSASDRSCES